MQVYLCFILNMSKKLDLTIAAPRYGLRPPDLARALGSSELARQVVLAGWIVPVIRRKKLTVYDSGDVARVWQRIRNGEVPPPIARKVVVA